MFYVCSCATVPEESAEPIVFAFPSRGASGWRQNGVARKWRRNGLK